MISLRTASVEDIAHIKSIAEEVWPVAYAQVISAEQIRYMLDMMYSDVSLRKQMLEENITFIIAEDENGIVGFAAFGMLADYAFKLHKLYVYSYMHGNGIGKLLLEKTCTSIKALGGKTLELQVNKKNDAKDFYAHNGFVIHHELVLEIGGGFVMDDYVMWKEM